MYAVHKVVSWLSGRHPFLTEELYIISRHGSCPRDHNFRLLNLTSTYPRSPNPESDLASSSDSASSICPACCTVNFRGAVFDASVTRGLLAAPLCLVPRIFLFPESGFGLSGGFRPSKPLAALAVDDPFDGFKAFPFLPVRGTAPGCCAWAGCEFMRKGFSIALTSYSLFYFQI